ncbi:MAG: hypothetical protein BGO97_13165 [Micrococcales bacterium 70-64]|nr:ComEC/Rec2 family competence protein [Leifsonia sp.]ODU64886.1 MAG: hypothetical protein ABT06_13165 [Leifsonia sp. SCN 70-46]OJX86578.1 MAG: hypothetical protein BGO97_13165 [Micrococcales bacterium 70-64]
MRRHRLALPALAAWAVTAVVVGLPGAELPVAVAGWLAAGILVLLSPRAALVALAVALCCTSVALHPRTLPERDSYAVTVTQTVQPGAGSFEGDIGGVPVLVLGEPPGERVAIGSVLAVPGELMPAEPGDDRAYLLFPRGAPEVLSGPPWHLAWADGLRQRFLTAADRLPGDGGDLLAGLAIGDTSAVGPRLDADMKAASLTHLTAVSGANCAVVIGLVMLAGGALGLPRAVRVGLSGAVLVAFVVLVTPEPSVLRAAAMAALVLLALGSGRPVQGIPVLSLAVVALLVADPWLARSFGFVLSVLATGGLLVLASPLAARLERWVPRWLALTIAVPLSATVACQPVIVVLNAALPTYGVVANILAEPAAPVATVVGLAACVALVIVPPVGELLCALAWLPSAWIAAVATYFARAPAAQLPWPEGLAGVALAALASALAVLALRRCWAVLCLALLVVAYGGVATGSRIGQALARPPDWELAACDVGQGDALLVRSGDATMLVDTGPDPAPLAECLATLGIGRLDLVVLTHWDQDHVGGVDAVVGRADRVLVGPADGDAARIVGALAAGGATVEQGVAGLGGVLGSLDWSLLWPPPRGVEPGNGASLTVRVGCASGCLTAVLLGDLGEEAQRRLPAVGHVDVVKVSHHGSSDQSEALYRELGATVGLIGVGAGNDYGHPTERLLGILSAVGTLAERTDEHGLILVAPGPDGSATVWTER